MITPAYSPTATERVLPRLALDFTTGVLDPRVTVSRALNTATRINASGLIEIVNANLPRFDYAPVALTPRGLLIEETRTNLLTYSDQMNNPIWQKNDITINSDALVSPDGTSNADTVVEGTAGTAFMSNAVTTTASATYTYSIFLKRGNTDWLRVQATDATNAYIIWVNVGTGAIGNNSTSGTGVYTGSTITSFGNGWYRVTITGSVPLTTTACRVNSAAANGSATRVANATYGVWGAQLEAGAFATSYIPTTTTSLTRNADVVQMTGTNFSDWYNASEGTAAVWFNGFESGNGNLLTFSNGTNQNFISNFVQAATTYGLYTIASGTLQASINFGTPAPLNAQNKIVMGYKAASNSASFNGAAVVAGNSGTIPTVDRLNIGSDPVLTAGNFFNGTMQRIFYWPYKLADAQIRAFAK